MQNAILESTTRPEKRPTLRAYTINSFVQAFPISRTSVYEEVKAKAATGRARIRAVLDAHGIAPRFNGYDQLSRAIIGKEMQVVVGRGTKAGLPVAKVVELLPPAAKDE